jgi:hypothetical protein
MALEFKGINTGGFGGYTLTDQLLYNLKWWIDWGIVNNGAFGVFQRGDSSYFDTTEAELHTVIDERYEEGRVWEGAGREWVWESGITVPSGEIEPFRVSGVYIDGTFYSQIGASGGTFGHHIDYQNGRIIFDKPQNNTIEAEFITRSVHVSFADTKEFREIMLNALEEFEQDISPSGTPAREHQIWLPAIFIEIDDGRQRGLQLGGGQIKTRFIHLHIFADNPNDRNLLKDWMDFQSRAAFTMADLNEITWPFDQYGDIISGITNWPDMATDFPGAKIRIQDAICRNLNSLNSQLFRARVTWEIEIDVGGI